jgi:hypothetical protein
LRFLPSLRCLITKKRRLGPQNAPEVHEPKKLLKIVSFQKNCFEPSWKRRVATEILLDHLARIKVLSKGQVYLGRVSPPLDTADVVKELLPNPL